MTTDIEDGIIVANAVGHVGELDGVGPEVFLVVQEVDGGGIALEHFHGARVEGRLAAFGGGDGELSFLLQNLPGMGEFRLFSQIMLMSDQ